MTKTKNIKYRYSLIFKMLQRTKTPMGFFKRRKLDTNNIPYGVFLARAYRYRMLYKHKG